MRGKHLVDFPIEKYEQAYTSLSVTQLRNTRVVVEIAYKKRTFFGLTANVGQVLE
ncbi:hypothetical protein GCM10007094_33750 [Pseudovibrio japonicus]|uniref:Transposase n=1 Tax=Pseudovibrio japonicus TaxID=366534 RepID=A0ABQ3EKQ9_9HYPH|nr:hypothetical protein GCM10007094_33750 [Pseudovibrio japonicus]